MGRIVFAVLLGLIVLGEVVLVLRDVEFARRSEPVSGVITGFSARGGGLGQTRFAAIRFEFGDAVRTGNAQLGPFCRPKKGPVAARYVSDGSVASDISDISDDSEAAGHPLDSPQKPRNHALLGIQNPLRIGTPLCRYPSLDGALLGALGLGLWGVFTLGRAGLRRAER